MSKTENTTLETGQFFGEWLVNKGVVTTEGLERALQDQQLNGGRLGEVIMRLRLADENQVTQALADYLNFDRQQITNTAKIDLNLARMIPENLARRFCAVITGEDENGKITLALADPLNIVAVDTIKHKLKRPVKLVISSTREIKQAIEAVYHGSDMEEQRLRDLVQIELDS